VKIGINTTAIDDGPSGARSRLEGLTNALLRCAGEIEIVLYLPEGAKRPILPAGRDVKHVITPFRPDRPLDRLFGAGAWKERLPGDRLAAFLTDYYPVVPGVRTFVTVHDVRYLDGWSGFARKLYFRRRMPKLLAQAAGVIAPSRWVAKRVVEELGVGEASVHVIPNAPDSLTFRPEGGREVRDAPYLVRIGPAEPRKNLGALVEIHRDVVTIGRRPQPTSRPFVATGPLPRARVAEHVRGAVALVEPSKHEGFGLTVIEAMAAGCPVIAARAGALPEVTAGAALLVDPDDPSAWQEAVERVELEPGLREGLAEEGIRRAAELTWDAAAVALADVIRPGSDA